MDEGWRRVHDLWFPPGLETAGVEVHGRMFLRWFGGGANAELPPFMPVLEAARAGHFASWQATPLGRLSLILVLDQFSRGLFAGTPEAYACDAEALCLAEEGLRNGLYDALAWPWEKTFFFLPLAHAEGPNHRARLERVVIMAEAVAREAPELLGPLYEHSGRQAQGHLEVITRFGRYPHRNPVLGRSSSTPEETAWLAAGDFVHARRPPRSAGEGGA